MQLLKIQKQCRKISNLQQALSKKRFFKTGKGEYGEGDDFLGINVPDSRAIAKEFKDLSLLEIKELLKAKFHEERLIGLMILQAQYLKAIKENDMKLQKRLFKVLYAHRKYVNNWDLVDSIAPYFSGHYFFTYDDTLLNKLTDSKSLWDRRIAIISLFYFIRQKDYKKPIELITKRLHDKEDLMHKACGWMLREIGNREERTLLKFLNEHASTMPRTALRYSIEKLNPKMRKAYLQMDN